MQAIIISEIKTYDGRISCRGNEPSRNKKANMLTIKALFFSSFKELRANKMR